MILLILGLNYEGEHPQFLVRMSFWIDVRPLDQPTALVRSISEVCVRRLRSYPSYITDFSFLLPNSSPYWLGTFSLDACNVNTKCTSHVFLCKEAPTSDLKIQNVCKFVMESVMTWESLGTLMFVIRKWLPMDPTLQSARINTTFLITLSFSFHSVSTNFDFCFPQISQCFDRIIKSHRCAVPSPYYDEAL